MLHGFNVAAYSRKFRTRLLEERRLHERQEATPQSASVPPLRSDAAEASGALRLDAACDDGAGAKAGHDHPGWRAAHAGNRTNMAAATPKICACLGRSRSVRAEIFL
ncbi:hypothetical protein MRX96_001152 [Rhipicephalus microplus]